MKKTKNITYFLLLCIMFSCSESIKENISNNPAIATTNTNNKININGTIFDSKTKEKLKDIEVEAKSFVVLDIVRGEIIAAKNENVLMPLASLTKIITTYFAYKSIPDFMEFKIKDFDLLPDGDSGLVAGEMWNALDLINYTMAVSSNDGSRALARTSSQKEGLSDRESLDSFIKNTNIELVKLGYSTMYINNESGLDENGKNGGYSSAYELSKFLTRSYTENPEIYDTTYETRPVVNKNETQKRVKGTNETANKTLGLLASKTGFTDIASGNLAVIVDISLGHPVAIVVLGSSRDGRFSDVENIRKNVFNSIKNTGF